MAAAFSEKVLIVDDDANLLAGLRRQLRGRFNVTTALGGREALETLQANAPFAVVVSDMRMPEMNGIQFLTLAAQVSPDTVRMMLTGNADIETAMHAVNEGNIFRFLSKPCHKDTLEWAIESGIKQYRLIKGERDLLEKTLKGSIHVLTGVLELINPLAFSRTSRVRNYVRQVTAQLKVADPWRYELAAMLSQIGCVTIPTDTLERVDAGGKVSDEEKRMVAEHPVIARSLLARIPRLEEVAVMVAEQQLDFSNHENLSDDALPEDVSTLGALILKATVDFDRLIYRGQSRSQAVGQMRKVKGRYHPLILKALDRVQIVRLETEIKLVNVRSLNESMALAENIKTNGGVLIAAKGQTISLSVSTLLRNYLERKEIDEFVRVQVRRTSTESEEETPGAAGTTA
jgi:response regulator RpfG family c-di-GMP phosphodiesterase